MTKANGKQEFLAFMNANKEVDSSLETQVLGKISVKTDPKLARILAKIFSLHIVAVLVTLVFCPQFGISIGSHNFSVNYMMQYGMRACMFGCGFIFLGVSAFSYTLALNSFERKKLQHSFLLLPLVLSTLSYAAFLIFNSAEFNEDALFWMMGSVVGGITVTTIINCAKELRLRKRLYA